MAGNYYGFQERKPESQVNWFDVGEGLKNSIQGVVKDRETRKAQLDKDMKDVLEEVKKVPLGIDIEQNAKVLQLGAEQSKYLLNLNRMLKAGEINPHDYTLYVQNAKDSTKNYFDAIENFNKTLQLKQDRRQKGLSQSAETDTAAYLEKFANFKDYQFFVGTDGNAYMGKKETKIDANGNKVEVITKNPNDIISTSAASNLANFTIDRFDANAKADGLAKSFGDYVTSELSKATVGRQGVIKTISDIKQSAGYQSMKTNAVAAALTNNFDRLSLLTENMASTPGYDRYSNTFDEKEFKKDKSKILLKFENGSITPVFHEEQIKASDKYFGDMLEARFKHEEEVKTTSQLQDQTHYAAPPSDAQVKSQEEYYRNLADANEIATTMYNAFYGDASKKQNAFEELGRITKGGTSFRTKDNTMWYKTVDPKTAKETWTKLYYGNDPRGAIKTVLEQSGISSGEMKGMVQNAYDKIYWSNKK